MLGRHLRNKEANENMKYIIAAVVALLVLATGALAAGSGGEPGGCDGNCDGNDTNPEFPCPNCPDVWQGNVIYQTNDQSSVNSQTGYTYQKAANWAVVAGDDNYLQQDNIQQAAVADAGAAYENSTNIALIVGNANEAYQLNDPMVQLNQLNEIIILGEGNYADQSNIANANATYGVINQDQWNFGLIFGNNSTLVQSNVANADNQGTAAAVINQTQANAAYLYGYENYVNQANVNDATVLVNCSSNIDQIAKNLAFAITSCCSPEFMPVCNNTSMEGECPTVPVTPPVAPEYPIEEYPLDP